MKLQQLIQEGKHKFQQILERLIGTEQDRQNAYQDSSLTTPPTRDPIIPGQVHEF